MPVVGNKLVFTPAWINVWNINNVASPLKEIFKKSFSWLKQFLIIPLGGLGSRFEREGYKTYKPFLPISSKLRIIDNIISNFPQKDTHVILIANNKKYNVQFCK